MPACKGYCWTKTIIVVVTIPLPMRAPGWWRAKVGAWRPMGLHSIGRRNEFTKVTLWLSHRREHLIDMALRGPFRLKRRIENQEFCPSGDSEKFGLA